MKQNIKDHLIKVNKENGWPYEADSDLWETLVEGSNFLWKEKTRSARWWDEYFYAVEIDGMLIGYYGAETTGDNNAEDLGWEPDYEKICNVERHEEKVIKVTYRPVS